jgi:hypothetical protein
MNGSAQGRCLAIALVGVVALGGCRGKFSNEACAEEERLDVPDSAVIAFYYDNRNKLVGKTEDMYGTEKNRMCPSPGVEPDDPGTCRKAGYCPVMINGTEVCVKPCPN